MPGKYKNHSSLESFQVKQCKRLCGEEETSDRLWVPSGEGGTDPLQCKSY